MKCPGCGCDETYQYDNMDDDFTAEGEEYERCAACGFVFDIDLTADDNTLTQP